MTPQEQSVFKANLKLEFQRLYTFPADMPRTVLTMYASWLEDKLIELQSQPSTTTPSDDVAAGHGAC